MCLKTSRHLWRALASDCRYRLRKHLLTLKRHIKNNHPAIIIVKFSAMFFRCLMVVRRRSAVIVRFRKRRVQWRTAWRYRAAIVSSATTTGARRTAAHPPSCQFDVDSSVRSATNRSPITQRYAAISWCTAASSRGRVATATQNSRSSSTVHATVAVNIPNCRSSLCAMTLSDKPSGVRDRDSELVMQPIHTVAEDAFIWNCGATWTCLTRWMDSCTLTCSLI